MIIEATVTADKSVGVFDDASILSDLSEMCKTIDYSKKFHPENISAEVKSKFHTVYTCLESLIDSWRPISKSVQTIDQNLWENDISLKYMFEEHITKAVDTLDGSENSLYCKLCSRFFGASSLNDHVKGLVHLDRFDRFIKDEQLNCESLWNDSLQKCKYAKFMEYKGPNLFCKICFTEILKTKKDLQTHVDSRAHIVRYEETVNALMGNRTGLEQSLCSVQGNQNDSMKLERFLSAVMDGLSTNGRYVKGSAFCCCACLYYTCSLSEWNEHILDNDHLSEEKKRNGYRTCKCVCDLVIVCDKQIYNLHLSQKMPKHLPATGKKTRPINTVTERKNAKTHLSDSAEANLNRSKKNRRIDSATERKNAKVYTSDGAEANLNPLNINDSYDNGLVDYTEMDYNYNFDSASVTSFTSSLHAADSRTDLDSIVSNDFRSGYRPNNTNESVGRKGKYRDNIRPRSKTLKASREKINFEQDSICTWGLKGLPIGTTKEEIMEKFMTYGDVSHVKMVDETKANVIIHPLEQYRNMLRSSVNTSVNINGVYLPISTPNYDETFVFPESVKVKFSSTEKVLRLALDLSKSAESSDIFDVIGIESSKRNAIENDIRLVSPEFKTVLTIGSRALGLAQPDAEQELYVEIDEDYHGKKCQNLFQLSARTAYISDMLRKITKKFSDVKVVGNEQVIEFTHKLTKVHCKLFCHNGLVFEKMNLIRLYLDYDERVRSVLFVILNWASETGLTEVVSEYAVMWLVLFSLMQGKDPLLVPVIVLKSNARQAREYVAGWNCNFCEDVSRLPKSRCQKETGRLINEFFKFYSATSFVKNTFAPLTGDIISKSQVQSCRLPPPFAAYTHLLRNDKIKPFIVTGGMCLQDPLEMNVNLTQDLHSAPLQKFLWMCRKTASMTRSDR